jgi:single-strand DNA-binding protein
MYSIKNRVQLIGYVGNPPDVRTTEKGRKWARFSIATHETYRSAKGEKVNETQWHNLVVWGKTAEITEKYVRKGSEIAVEGKLVSYSYLDKEGNKKYGTEVQVSEVLLLGEKRSDD